MSFAPGSGTCEPRRGREERILIVAKWISAVLALFFLSSVAPAQTGPLEQAIETQNGIDYLILREESEISTGQKVWTVDVYRTAPGELQERVLIRHFDRKSKAEAFMARYKRDHELPPPEGEADMPAASPVLEPVTATEAPGQVLWKVTQNWSWDWELKYAQWVKANVDANFFQKYRIKTDCADVAIGLRWIFARINGLPVANTMAGSGVLFTQDSMKKSWVGLRRSVNWFDDQLFLAALDYVMDTTYTKTLIKDSYPIQINPQVFLPGVHHLEFHSQGGHTMLVTSVDPGGSFSEPRLVLVQSTVPRDFRVLGVTTYNRPDQPDENDGGFMRIRWAEKSGRAWTLKAAASHPGYSNEQHQAAFMAGYNGFSSAVKARLSNRFDQFKEFEASLQDLRESLKKRVRSVEQGYLTCQQIDCGPRTAAYNEWSSPIGDSRLKKKVVGVVEAYQKNQGDRRYQRAWADFLRLREIFVGNQVVPMQTILENVYHDKITSDPRDPVLKRWGFAG